MLYKRGWTPVVSDKDGSFVLVPTLWLRSHVTTLMDEKFYEPIAWLNLDLIGREVKAAARAIVRRAPGAQQFLSFGDLNKIAATILYNMKTHKKTWICYYASDPR